MLDLLMDYFNEWQAQGYEQRPDWCDEYIDEQINNLSNVELLWLIDMLKEEA